MSYKIVEQFGSQVDVLDSAGELWSGVVIGRLLSGARLVALVGPRTGEVVVVKSAE